MQLNTNKTGCITCFGKKAKASPPGSGLKRSYLWNRILLIFTVAFLLFVFSVQVMAGEPNPKITLSRKNTTLQDVFKEIQRQTKYAFVYNNEMMRETKRISIDVKDASLEHVLGILFKDQPVTYSVVENIVVVKRKHEEKAITDTLSGPSLDMIDLIGNVVDDQSNPVQRASISVSNKSSAGTASDVNGRFFLKSIPKNSKITITSIGFEPFVFYANAENNGVRAVLKVSANKLDEGLVVAYRTVSKRSNTGAVTVVKGQDILTQPNMSFDKSLQGLVPGLVVTSGSGQPGSTVSNFVLRGIATGGNPENGATFRNPLVVIDGIPVTQDPIGSSYLMPGGDVPAGNPMAQINPSDIESISVLKDASATSLYGSKASNGVLVITTKKGQSGKTSFSFRHQTDVAQRSEGRLKMLDQQQYIQLVKESYLTTYPSMTEEEIMSDLYSKFPTHYSETGGTSFYPVNDWVKAVYNDRATSTLDEFSISGGSVKSTFYLNLQYAKQNGVIRKTDYDRKSVRFNVDTRLASWIKIGVNTSFSYNVQNFAEVFGTPEFISPLLPIRDKNNEYIKNFSFGLSGRYGASQPNPVAAAEKNISRNTAYRTTSSITTSIYPLKYVSFNNTLGVDFLYNETLRKVHPDFVLPGESEAGRGRVTNQNYRNMILIATNTLQFDKVFAKNHAVSILLGQEAQSLNNKTIFAQITNIASNPSLEDVFGSGATASSINRKTAQLSYFSQLSYGFRDKIFINGTLRKDGSSQFGQNVRFGTYWSAGTSYILSEEPIVKAAIPGLEVFKVRASVGSSGNSSAIPSYLRFDRLTISPFENGISVIPYPGVNPGNKNIQWESTVTWNAGIELGFLKNRIFATADLYVRKTKNLIANDLQLPLSSGFNKISGNVGDIKNTGIELTLTANLINSKDFNWNLIANWSRNRNRLTKAYAPLTNVAGSIGLINEVGREYNSFYLPEWYGVNPDNGRPMWIDSSTGKPTENYYAAKSVIAGKAQPDGTMAVTNSFLYKGIDFSFRIYYQYGAQMYYSAGASLINDGAYPYNNQVEGAYNRWSKPGQNVINPRRTLEGYAENANGDYDFDEGTAPSTRYIYDADFLRLAMINLGYNFPSRLLNKIHISSLRIYFQGNNLGTWTKNKGNDPENINVFSNADFLYPIPKSFSGGVQIGF